MNILHKVYDGVEKSQGHPWFIASLSCAEMLYRTAKHFRYHEHFRASRVNLSDHATLKFWKQFDHQDTLQIGSEVDLNSQKMADLLLQVRSVADEYVEIVGDWIGNNGSMHEQFDRYNGTARGARDLTYVNFGCKMVCVVGLG